MWSNIFSRAVYLRELSIWLACFMLSFAVSLFIIIKYAAPWQEIFSSLGSVVVESLLMYGLVLILRVAWRLLSYLWRK